MEHKAIIKARSTGYTATTKLQGVVPDQFIKDEMKYMEIGGDTEVRMKQLEGIEQELTAEKDKTNALLAAGKPFTNRNVYYLDEYERPMQFYNPFNKKTAPRVNVPIHTQVNILGIRGSKAWISYMVDLREIRRLVELDAITIPAAAQESSNNARE